MVGELNVLGRRATRPYKRWENYLAILTVFFFYVLKENSLGVFLRGSFFISFLFPLFSLSPLWDIRQLFSSFFPSTTFCHTVCVP